AGEEDAGRNVNMGRSKAFALMLFGKSNTPSRSDALKVAVGLQPTCAGAGWGGIASATPALTTGAAMSPLQQRDGLSSAADATLLGLGGAGPWAEAARLPSLHRYAMENKDTQPASGP